MSGDPSATCNETTRRLAAALLLAALVGCRTSLPRGTPVAAAAPIVEAAPEVVGTPVKWDCVLTCEQCVKVTLERHPRLAAQRASLAGAEDSKRALDKMRLAAAVDQQIPIRRQQSDLGLVAASAALSQAELEVKYAVVRNYLTVLYAREQEAVAKRVVDRLTATRDTAQRGLDEGVKDVTVNDVNRAVVYLKLAETRRIQASEGVKRAAVSLREAMGLGPEVTLDIPEAKLPEPTVRPTREEVVSGALNCRGELIQVRLAAQVTSLEADAQKTSHALRMPTFAAGSDIHATQVPQGNNGAEYRPATVPPEMPTVLVGSKAERVKHAQTLAARASDVATTTRNLVSLEAEDALLRYEEATHQAKEAKEAAAAGDTLAEDLRKDFAAGLKVKVEEVVSSGVLASQARSEYIRFLYQQLVALADIERATGGRVPSGICELLGKAP